MMKITIGKQVYQSRGILGLIGTILMLPGMGLAVLGGFLLALVCIILMLPGILVSLITAKRVK